MKYIAIDGDDVGRTLTKIIYESTTDKEISDYSNAVVASFEQLKEWVLNKNGIVMICTGDSILYKIHSQLVEESLNKFDASLFKISVGIGNSTKEAHWALNVAKSLGKNRVIDFEEIKPMIFGQES